MPIRQFDPVAFRRVLVKTAMAIIAREDAEQAKRDAEQGSELVEVTQE